MSSNTSGVNIIETTSRDAFPSTPISRSTRWDTREGDVRARIFKMTRARDNISFIYRESLRGVIASFNDIGYIDSEEKFNNIKIIHANAERAIAKLKQENNIVLPIISVSQTVSDNDDSRRRNESVLVHEKYWDAEKNRAFRILSLSPRAVNIRYKVNIWCKYMADMDQILEQFRLKFNPEMEVPTKFSTIAKASIESEEDTGSVIAGDKEDRLIRKTLNIVLRTYIPNPKFLVTSTGKIEEFKGEVQIYNDRGGVTESRDSIITESGDIITTNPDDANVGSNLNVTYTFAPSGGSLTTLEITAPSVADYTEYVYYDAALGRNLTTSYYEDFTMSNGIGFMTQWEKFPNKTATRITATLVNGVKDAGTFYARGLNIKVGADIETLLNWTDNFCVMPGGVYPWRCVVGRDATQVENFTYLIPSVASHNTWINTLMANAITDRLNFGAYSIGPFRLGWGDNVGESMYNGSHGGWNLGVRAGGPSDWVKVVPNGWKAREEEMLLWSHRSLITKTDTDNNFVVDAAIGSQGRYIGAEKDGWQYIPTLRDLSINALSGTVWEYNNVSPGDPGDANKNGGCYFLTNYDGYVAGDALPNSYFYMPGEPELRRAMAPRDSHFSRITRAASALAPQDAFARWFLRNCFNDVANALGHDGQDHGPPDYSNKYYYNLSENLEYYTDAANVGAEWGGRGFGHQLRAYLYARPYLPVAEDTVPDSLDLYLTSKSAPKDNGVYYTWYDAFRYAVQYIATPYGATHRMTKTNSSEPLEVEYNVANPVGDYARSRELDLVGVNFVGVGFDGLGLTSLDTAWKTFCAPIESGSCTSSIAATVQITTSAAGGDFSLVGPNWSDGLFTDYAPNYGGANPCFPNSVPNPVVLPLLYADRSLSTYYYNGGGQSDYDGWRGLLGQYSSYAEIESASQAQDPAKNYEENVWDSFDRQGYLDTL
jgi:hypothetical protein